MLYGYALVIREENHLYFPVEVLLLIIVPVHSVVLPFAKQII